MAASWVLLKAFRNFQMSSIGRRNRTSVSTYNSESTSFRITWYQKKYLVTVSVVRWKTQTNEQKNLSSRDLQEETASGQHMVWRVSSIHLHSPQRRWLDICCSETWRTPSEATHWTVRRNWKNQCHDCQPSVNCTSIPYRCQRREVCEETCINPSKEQHFVSFVRIVINRMQFRSPEEIDP